MADFSMSRLAEKDHHLLQTFVRAEQRAKKKSDYLRRYENRFAFFRLIFILALAAVLVEVFLSQDNFMRIFFLFLFVILFLIFEWLHSRLKNNQMIWKGYSISYRLSQARLKRDFATIKKYSHLRHAPQHQESGNLYSCDLDVFSHLYPLLQTCLTMEGAKKLSCLLSSSGESPEQKDQVRSRLEQGKYFSERKTTLRRLECISLFQSGYKKNNETVNETENFDNKVGFFHFFYIYMSLFFWLVLFVFASRSLFVTHQLDSIFRGLIFYGFFILGGVLVFRPVVREFSRISSRTAILERVAKTLGKEERLKNPHFLFLQPQTARRLRGVNIMLSFLTLRGNPVFWLLLHLVFPFDALLCFFLSSRLNGIKADLRIWEKELSEFDLVICFARFACENPTSRFLSDEEINQASCDGIVCLGLGHPLLPSDLRVCNDFILKKERPVVLLTGSNMSGKSTFLRALGVNILLANMGAPVCAARFVVPPLRLLCAIRIHDSLEDGLSYFYAEVKRIAAILKSLDDVSRGPALFLIDEIFKGTNNRERLLGGLSVLRALFEKHSFGLVTTHDLALVRLEQQDSRLRNLHFKEQIKEDEIVFDYLIQEGPCPTTNALRIMKRYGIPVSDEKIDSCSLDF